MITRVKKYITSAIKYRRGFTTDRKFVVFESDDWGSIRMPSIAAYHRMTDKGLNFNTPGGVLFNKYDTLASKEDLMALYDVLTSVKDGKGNHAKFTALTCVTNPDFDKIRKEKFSRYYYENFQQTLGKYYPNSNPWPLWEEGIASKIFIPYSHGREHLNTISWMNGLDQKDSFTHIAFDEGCWCFDRAVEDSYQIAFNVLDKSDIVRQRSIVLDAVEIFESTFGYSSTFFVPPNGIIHPDLMSILKSNGVEFVYSSFRQPMVNDLGDTRSTYNYLGERNKYGQRFIIRNCIYEPSQPGLNWTDFAMSQIENAFLWKKPAILGPHRKNFIGQHVEANRTSSLKSLKDLLVKITHKWPDVEFVTSHELGKIMSNEN